MIKDIKKILVDKSLVIGSKRTLKKLKVGKIKMVFLAKNTAEKIKKDILNCAKNVEVNELEITNEELGMLCKKPYKISVVSI